MGEMKYDFEEWVADFANNPDRVIPNTEWATNHISVQMMWEGDDLHAVIEVLESYPHFSELDEDTPSEEAPGELGDIATRFSSILSEELGEDLEFDTVTIRPNPTRVQAAFYGIRV